MVKLNRWKQANPFDQLIVVRSSFEMHLENFVSGIIPTDKFQETAKNHLAEIKKLQDFLMSPPELWNQEWTLDDKSNTWFYGTQERGAGVYQQNGKWFGNLLHPGTMMIVGYGPASSKEALQKELIEQLKKLDAML